MRGELQVRPSVTVAVLCGELDMVVVDEVRALLDQALAGNPQRLVVDVSGAPFVDLLCLSAILSAIDRTRDAGGQAFLVGAAAPLRRMCALLGADDALVMQLPTPRVASA